MTKVQEYDSETMISIVIPVFNVADYLEECLRSIETQEFEHRWEGILIDDCSTDSSADICRRFIEKHPSADFRLIENPTNCGVSATRNRGLDEARGRYFMFIDPDDCLAPGALAALYEAAERFSAAIVKGNNTIFDERQERAARYDAKQQSLIRGEQVLTTLFQHDRVRGHPWGKLFRRDVLGHCRFPLGVRMAQDLFYCSEVFSQADSLLLITQCVYRYRNRDTGSTGSKFRSGSYMDWLDSVQNTSRFATTPGQRRAHKNLLVRTMTQLARECRKLPPSQADKVLEVIETRCEKWQISGWWLLWKDGLGLRSLLRYFKMRLAIREIRSSWLKAS